MNYQRLFWSIVLSGVFGSGVVSVPTEAGSPRGRSRPAPPKEIYEFVGTITQIDLKSQELTVSGANKMTNRKLGTPTTRTFKMSPFCRVKGEDKPFWSLKDLTADMAVEVIYDVEAKGGLITRNILVTSTVSDPPTAAKKK
jgi:hypothetical protein